MGRETPAFETVRAPEFSEPAPDGSKILPLVRTEQASVGIIELQPGQITAPVRHQSIEEIWYVLEGRGELWRRFDSDEQIVDLDPGTCVTLPTGAGFQFRAGGNEPLRMLMLTIPPWPGPEEAVATEGPWRPGSSAASD